MSGEITTSAQGAKGEKMELIDRAELAQQIHYMKVAVNTINTDYNTGYHSACSGIEGLIASLPTITTEPYVRCKDCKHKPTGSGVNHDVIFPDRDYKCPCRCEDFWYSWVPDDNWFCANGEREVEE